MTDGYAALAAEIASGDARAPRPLSLDQVPPDLTGVAFGMEYRGADRKASRRWVTVRRIEDGKMIAYCWKSRALKTFRLDRIQSVFDGAGEVVTPTAFFEAAGIFFDPPAAPAPTPRRAPRPRVDEIDEIDERDEAEIDERDEDQWDGQDEAEFEAGHAPIWRVLFFSMVAVSVVLAVIVAILL
ncbi:MAG: hypothetical protein HQL39_18785 [Alphaproteobacteria bacterium]|nr:hypothetical protein [Alphaproteobacteria bacterium]